ncbi:MAG: 50S ribosomal protein L29 [bacterium]|nr:50S ribosomal protein L29 [bacterium]
MKKKAIIELRQKSVQELQKLSKELRNQIVKLKMESQMEKTKNHRMLSRTRDDLARVLTILRANELQKEKNETI